MGKIHSSQCYLLEEKEVYMKEKIDFKVIKEHAKRVKKEYPELFDYLVRRDHATAELARTIMDSIPHPDDLPAIRIPFIDAVIELAEPNENCPICKDEDSLWLTPQLRSKLCEICKNGIYLRGTGIGSLAD